MKSIALMGECMIELNGAPFGAMQQTYGGDSLNTAVYLARASAGKVAVRYVTALGVDPLSEGMIRRFQQEGVNTDDVLRDPAHTPGLYLIQLDQQGERTFLYWRNNSAARYMLQHTDWPRVETGLRAVDMIYVSGISLAILPSADRDHLLTLLATLHAAGKKIVFDSNYRPALWASVEQTQRDYLRLLAITSLALVTNDDEETLWGDRHSDDTLQRLRAAGVAEAVVKQGAKGCVYQHLQKNSAACFIPTTPLERVVDTTSAGDAFNAGFLCGYLQGCDSQQAAKMGHQLAAVVISHRGAIIPAEHTAPVIAQFTLI